MGFGTILRGLDSGLKVVILLKLQRVRHCNLLKCFGVHSITRLLWCISRILLHISMLLKRLNAKQLMLIHCYRVIEVIVIPLLLIHTEQRFCRVTLVLLRCGILIAVGCVPLETTSPQRFEYGFLVCSGGDLWFSLLSLA